jgi:hypothetical protein
MNINRNLFLTKFCPINGRMTILLLLVFILSSCSNNNNQGLVKQMNNQIEDLQDQLDHIIKNDNYKRDLISSIESNLDTIDSTNIYFKGRTEDKIFLHIKNIKKNIQIAKDNLKNEIKSNRKLDLKRQQEINSLLKKIKSQKLMIFNKENKINEQQKIIKSKNDLVTDKNNIILNKEFQITELKNKIKEKLKIIKNKNDIIKGKENIIFIREYRIDELKKLILEKEKEKKLIAERTKMFNSIESNCNIYNTGDLCFTNYQNRIKYVTFFIKGNLRTRNTFGEVAIDPGQTKCFYNIKANIYKVVFSRRKWSWHMFDAEGSMNIVLKKCESLNLKMK